MLFTGAIDIVNSLASAPAGGSIKRRLDHCVRPQVRCIDELGHLPIETVPIEGGSFRTKGQIEA